MTSYSSACIRRLTNAAPMGGASLCSLLQFLGIGALLGHF
jgi:hypothetical protein